MWMVDVVGNEADGRLNDHQPGFGARVMTGTPLVEKMSRRDIFLRARYDVSDDQFYICGI
jgi:hypothetical protein